MNPRTIFFGAAVLGVSFLGATILLDLIWPPPAQPARPALLAVPPLQPLTGTSTVLAPATVAFTAIRDALEAQAPKNLAGKRQNPASKLLSGATISWTINRGPLSVTGRPDALAVATPLNGTFQALGTITGGVTSLTGALGGVISSGVGQSMQNLTGKVINQHADIRGTITTTARPTIAPNWRLDPNLASQINVADVAVPVAGIVKLSVAGEVKPFLDNAVQQQTGALEARLRNDPFIEKAARSEWAKLCRAIPLGAAGQGMPDLWLEMRPTRAIAAQPRIGADAVTLLVGVQADTRIVPMQTKPDCPFPQQLDIVQQANEGTVSIAVPIDIPFPEVSRLLDAQIKGKTFPEDGRGSFAATIRQASVAASGDRLLISLLVHIKRRGLFSVGADATVNVWGKPVLDQEHQILRFADVALDVQSNAAFGLVGEAAQAALPYMQKTLADKAAIDLKPFADNARKRISAAVGNLVAQAPGLSANVTMNDLRLVGIAYDSKVLRVIANASGTVNAAITSLAGL